MFVVTLYCAGKTSREIKASTGLGFPVDFLQKLRKDLLTFRVKIAQICTLMCKSYSAQILKKILVFAYFFISCYFVILLNFEKQFQEMMNEFKIKPIRATDQARQLYSNPLGAHICRPNGPQFSGFRSPDRSDQYSVYQ